jgi:hypothetical protein
MMTMAHKGVRFLRKNTWKAGRCVMSMPPVNYATHLAFYQREKFVRFIIRGLLETAMTD